MAEISKMDSDAYYEYSQCQPFNGDMFNFYHINKNTLKLLNLEELNFLLTPQIDFPLIIDTMII